jgi:hypothetical protein
MKRLTSLLISSVFALSLFGCNSQAPNFLDQQNMLQNTVTAQSAPSIMSDEGLYEFIKVKQRKIFQAYDKNQDGYITKDEFKGFDDFFTNIDLDGNQRVSFKEATSSKWFFFDLTSDGDMSRKFERLIFDEWIDKDADEHATRDEFLNVFPGPNPSAANSKYYKTLFTKNDVNKDGILDFSEYEDAMYQLWKRDIIVQVMDWGLIISFNGYNKP